MKQTLWSEGPERLLEDDGFAEEVRTRRRLNEICRWEGDLKDIEERRVSGFLKMMSLMLREGGKQAKYIDNDKVLLLRSAVILTMYQWLPAPDIQVIIGSQEREPYPFICGGGGLL